MQDGALVVNLENKKNDTNIRNYLLEVSIEQKVKVVVVTLQIWRQYTMCIPEGGLVTLCHKEQLIKI